MVSAWTPLNVIILPFVPILVLLENKAYILNSILLFIVYTPVALIAITFELAVLCVVSPISYLVLNFKNFLDLTYCRG